MTDGTPALGERALPRRQHQKSRPAIPLVDAMAFIDLPIATRKQMNHVLLISGSNALSQMHTHSEASRMITEQLRRYWPRVLFSIVK